MHGKGASGRRDSIAVTSGNLKEGKMPNCHPTAESAPTTMISGKSTAFLQCKSLNLKVSMLPKPPSVHDHNKTAKSNGASTKLDVMAGLENGGKASKPNTANKSSELPARYMQKDNGALDPKAQASAIGRSERIKSSGNGSLLKSSSSPESLKKNTRQPSSNPSSEGDLAASKVKKSSDTSREQSSSSFLNADPRKKLPPIKTARVAGAGRSVSTKNTANLCAECKAELEGAVCFIGNDGRVSACTSRTAVRLCKNLKCANNNPEHVASLAAKIAAPKKYLVSRRHSLNLPRSSSKVTSDKVPAQSPNQNRTTAHCVDDGAVLGDEEQEGGRLEMEGGVEDDVTSLEDMGDVVEIDGAASASAARGRANGFHRMRRRSFSVIETEAPEVVTLKKQMMQERKQAEEWMLDYAIEEALHRLAPSKDSKVKALVEAFESVIIPQKDAGAAVVQDRLERPKTPHTESG